VESKEIDMGYRSDVAALFYAADKKDFPVVKLWLQENFPVEMFKDSIRWFDRGIVFEIDNVKWYDDYEDVKAFEVAREKFVDMFCLESNGAKGAVELMRVGENYDDIEHDGWGEYEGLLECERSIRIDI
jgi:nitrogenase molybdenum-iron protein alpha/beta subunit